MLITTTLLRAAAAHCPPALRPSPRPSFFHPSLQPSARTFFPEAAHLTSEPSSTVPFSRPSFRSSVPLPPLPETTTVVPLALIYSPVGPFPNVSGTLVPSNGGSSSEEKKPNLLFLLFLLLLLVFPASYAIYKYRNTEVP
jgi:hypothetical protein